MCKRFETRLIVVAICMASAAVLALPSPAGHSVPSTRWTRLASTAATYYDEHMPESSIEILGHSVGGVTYRHYAHRDPLAFKAIMTLPQPTAFTALHHGFDGECPCCRRKFDQA